MIFKKRDRATIRYPTLYVADYYIEDNLFSLNPINQTTGEPVANKTLNIPASAWNVFPEYRIVKPDLIHSHGQVAYHIMYQGTPVWVITSQDPDYGIMLPALEGYSISRARAEYELGKLNSLGIYPFSKELQEDRYQPGKAFIGSTLSNDALQGYIISIYAKSIFHPRDGQEIVREINLLTEEELLKDSQEEFYTVLSTIQNQTLVVLSISDLKIVK